MNLFEELNKILPGKVTNDGNVLEKYKHDASVFEMKPKIVVFPENSTDIEKLVQFVKEYKKKDPKISISVRAAGTCMSGGSLTQEILIVLDKMDNIKSLGKTSVTLEPGVFYRDLEKKAGKLGVLYPPYPSSKLLCKIGGIVSNNAGGEKSLKHGKAKDYVQKLKVILKDGNEYEFEKINKNELEKKMKRNNAEGDVYKKVFKLITENQQLIHDSLPTVSKNSTGYNIWEVWDGESFDMTKLFTGAQGTLGIITEAKLKLVPKTKHTGLLAIYLNDYNALPDIVNKVLAYNPDSFESYDDQTLKLALKYFYGLKKALKSNLLNTFLAFLPEFIYILKNGMPKLVLIVEFEDESLKTIRQNLRSLKKDLNIYKDVVQVRIAKNKLTKNKYWAIRRESFNLLRQRVQGKHAAPFIDDTIVDPKRLTEFFPRVYKILNEENLQYTIAGHIGNGNFHIIPLMNMSDPSERNKIYKSSKKVFDLVWEYSGSMSGEHNDGLIRAPFLREQYGEKVYKLFTEIKNIFDPDGIFNPKKKIGVTQEYASQFFITGDQKKQVLDYSAAK